MTKKRGSKSPAPQQEPELDRIDRLLEDDEAVAAALRKGVHDALVRHKKLGQPVVVWRDGKVVWIPPEEIPVDDGPKT